MASYEILVRFIRFTEDDLEIAENKFPNDTTVSALQKQFVREQQEAYDQGLLTGQFEVLETRMMEPILGKGSTK